MSNPAEEIQRQVLPIPDRAYQGLITYDAKDPDTSFPPIEPLRPPADAPNVLIVLLDDIGFGASSAFGGPCRTPTAERLAEGGQIDLSACGQGEPISVAVAHDERVVAAPPARLERLAQTRDEHLEVPAGGDRIASRPERLHQHLAMHRATLVQREQPKETPGARCDRAKIPLAATEAEP